MHWMPRLTCLFALTLVPLALACSDDGAPGDDSASETTGDGDGDASGDGDGDTSGDGDGDTPGDGDGDDGPPGPPSAEGCDGATFYELPEDPSARGPWAVGVTTTVLEGVTTEIWYPAAWNSEAGVEATSYDIRYALPESEQGKISDEQNPIQDCDCYRDLPIDAEHGPYPVVVFVHGTASWRTQSLTQMTHWASRGFIVVSQDHAGLWLRDSLGIFCGLPMAPQDLGGDTDKALAALAAPSGELEFLAGHIDTSRVAISGHSAGGSAAATLTNRPGIRVSIPMASGQAVQDTSVLESSLLLGGLADGVVAYSGTQSGYASSPTPKRLVGIENAGHLAFSDICELTNDQGQDILEVALETGVCGAEFAGFLFDCNPDFIDAATAIELINYSSSAVLEEILMCREGPDLFADFAQRTGVAEYQQEL